MATLWKAALQYAQKEPTRAAGALVVGFPVLMFLSPLLLGLALLTAPVLVPAFAFCAVRCPRWRGISVHRGRGGVGRGTIRRL